MLSFQGSEVLCEPDPLPRLQSHSRYDCKRKCLFVLKGEALYMVFKAPENLAHSGTSLSMLTITSGFPFCGHGCIAG